MRGDFSRDSYARLAGFSRVLQQQGRIGIEADGNEREAIQLGVMRRLVADLVGPYGGPQGAFQLGAVRDLGFDFSIGPGSYYVAGWPIANESVLHYRGDGKDRPGQPGPRADQPKEGTYLAWLEVWERHLSAVEHDGGLKPNDPRRLAEVALSGQDTASRAQIVWAVRMGAISRDAATREEQDWAALLNRAAPRSHALLSARAIDPAAAETDDPCLVAPTSAYRGVENQLYRVEIWKGGTAAGGASFVWSRENGSVLFAVETIAGTRIRLAEGWHDARFGLGVGDYVSIEGPDQRLGAAAPLCKVTAYYDESVEIEVDTAPGIDAGAGDVVLRRWDHRQRPVSTGSGRIVDGAIALAEGEWINLEDGISVRFSAPHKRDTVTKADAAAAGVAVEALGNRLDVPPLDETMTYRAGDYWLIPARTAIGDVLWPSDGDAPAASAPHGVERHVAPLGVVAFDGQGQFSLLHDLRKAFTPLAE